MNETHLTVIGTLITHVNRHRLTDGGTFVTFRVASNERRFDRATATWSDGDSLYVSVTCWRQLAENVHRSFNLGDPIIVRGRLRTRSYEDKEGRRQSVIELDGLAVGPNLARATATITRMRPDGTPALSSRGSDDHAGTEQPGRDTDPGDGPGSDDPWRIAEEATAGATAESATELGAAAEVAVGA
jgi:single-strand DNA-binding protein